MPLDPINPIGPRPARLEPTSIPAVRRPEGATEKRRGDADQQKRKRRETLPDLPPPPDDGMPHIDVRV